MPLDSMHKCIKCKELVHAVCAVHISDAPLGSENICTICYTATDGDSAESNHTEAGSPSDSVKSTTLPKNITAKKAAAKKVVAAKDYDLKKQHPHIFYWTRVPMFQTK